jgi:hypothetical protein
VTESVFYSDRVGRGKSRVSEIVSAEAWAGLTDLIQQRINDGSLARAFPRYACPDDPGRSTVTGTDEEMFIRSLKAYVPGLIEPPAVPAEGQDTEPDAFGWLSSRAHTPEPTRSPLDPDKAPDTTIALDVVDFVALHIDQPVRTSHSYFGHTHYSFEDQRHNLHFGGGLSSGQAQFQHDIDLLFARNGVAFTLGDDLRVQRLGPPEARLLISDFRPSTGDPQLDDKLNDAMARFLSRNPVDRRDALEKLWDAFERLKTLELGGGALKKPSAAQLVAHTASGSDLFRELLDTEFQALTKAGNTFTIRHHEHDQEDLPTDAAANYLFLRLASLIALVLRVTGRMAR